MIKSSMLIVAGCLTAFLCSCEKQEAEISLAEYEVAALVIKLPSEPEKYEPESPVLMAGALASEDEEANNELFVESETYRSYLKDAVVTVSRHKYRESQQFNVENNLNEIIAELEANSLIKLLRSEVTKEEFVKAPCFRGSITYEIQGERINQELLEFAMDNEYWKIQVLVPMSLTRTMPSAGLLAERIFDSLSIK